MTPPKAKGADRRPLIASILIAVSVGIVVVAQRDLHGRPATQVRGSKRIWRLACLNALGAIAYLAWGRTAPFHRLSGRSGSLR